MLSDIIFTVYILFSLGYAAIAYLPQFNEKRYEIFKKMNGVNI